jgi:hypothetical protein
MDRRDARVDDRETQMLRFFLTRRDADGLAGADASASGTEALASRAH